MQQNNTEHKNKCLILMGIKHCGKSTQGKYLSAYFECPFYDTDDLIIEQTGKQPRELYALGPQVFMAAETEACRRLSEMLYKSATDDMKAFRAVIATGGGICNNEQALEVLRSIGIFVFLSVDETVASDRIVREVVCSSDGSLNCLPAYIAKENPQSIEDVRASFHQFYINRVEKYKKICDVAVLMPDAPKNENMKRIIEAVRSAEVS